MGFGRTKEYSLRPTLKKSVNYINGNVNGMLNSRFCLHSPKLFSTFALVIETTNHLIVQHYGKLQNSTPLLPRFLRKRVVQFRHSLQRVLSRKHGTLS
nr:MAG TPA: hypothetical protein [Ackermannviridae sp.]